MVEMLSVVSSNVEQIGYSNLRKLLFIRFKGGVLYKYSGVEQDVFDEMRNANSVGSFISGRIKGVYDYAKCGENDLQENAVGTVSPTEVKKVEEKTIFLVDFSWLYYRSKYAFINLSHEINGVKYATGAIHGIYQALSDIFYFYKDVDVFLCIDGVARKQAGVDADYKGTRNKTQKSDVIDLKRMDIAKPFTLVPRIRVLYEANMEADDTIAFAVQVKNPMDKIVIFSSDGDLRQLIGENVWCCSSNDENGFVLEDEDYLFKNGPKGLEGLKPKAIPLYLAITGDSSDNIKGVYRFKKALAKQLANECITIDRLRNLLNSAIANASKYQKEFIQLRDEMSLVENNYKLTKLDPIRIPKVYNTFNDSKLEYFDYYNCVKAKAGVERLITEQR